VKADDRKNRDGPQAVDVGPVVRVSETTTTSAISGAAASAIGHSSTADGACAARACSAAAVSAAADPPRTCAST
jgi:hypothetical protein